MMNPLPEVSYALCARVEIRNAFAIYDIAAMDEITGDSSVDPQPWLDIEAIVIDESNFKTGENWRRLQLMVVCPANVAAGLSTPGKYTAPFRAFLSPLKELEPERESESAAISCALSHPASAATETTGVPES